MAGPARAQHPDRSTANTSSNGAGKLRRRPPPRRPPVVGAQTTDDVLSLQSSAGNRATANLLSAGTPQVQRTQTTRGSVHDVAYDVMDYIANARTGPKLERMLSGLLANHDRAADLRADYRSQFGRDLDADLASLGGADAVRALDSLNYGELRVMSKVLIAMAGAGTDTTTLYRVLKEANRAAPAGTGLQRFETMWQAVAGSLPAGVFPRFASGTLEGHLDDDLDGYELIKAYATLGHGDLRPIDKVYIAMNQSGTDEDLLFEGLGRCHPDTVEAQYRDYEFRGKAWSDNAASLWDSLDSELSGEAYRRALALVDREPNPEYGWVFGSSEKTRRLGTNQRLVALVKAAVKGAGTNFELILSSVDEATTAEKAELKTLVEDPADPLGLSGWFGDLSDADLGRLKAKLGITETPGQAWGVADESMLADPTVQLLRGMGGVDNSTVFDAIKKTSGGTWLNFRQRYTENGPFTRYVDANTVATDQAYLITIFSTDLDTRIRFCFGTLSDDEEYLYNLLENFASNADRRRLAADATMMSRFRDNLSTSELNRVFTLLKPTDLTPQENAAWINQAVERERSATFDLTSATGEAVADENRELQVGTRLSYLDDVVSPEERRLLESRSARTEGALEAYTAARDEFANTASMIANVAVSVIIAAVTGGAAGPVLLAQLARAAAAMAVAKVLTEKVIRGDRFDIIGADGAVAFATGAVEGVMNVAGGLAAKNALSGSLEAIGLSAQQASGSLFRAAGRGGLLAAAEGGMAGGSTSFVDTLARDETWRDGILQGFERTATNTVIGAGTGAGMSVAIHGIMGGIGELRAQPNEDLPLMHRHNPLKTLVLQGDREAIGRLLDRLGRWETAIREIQGGTGAVAGIDQATRDGMIGKLVAHRQGIVDHLKSTFDAATQPTASTTPISDVDLNLRGDNAGRNLIAAEQYLDTAHPGWRTKYRMGLLIDANRIGSVEQALAGLPDAVKARVRARVTQQVATLIYARRLRFASPMEHAALLADPPAGVDAARAQQIAGLGDDARLQLRNQALQRGDDLAGQLRAATDPTVRQDLAEQLTFQQMLANTMDDEAYLSGGGVKGFALGQQLTNAHEMYQALLDQIGMMAHAVHEAGGVLEASRSYELFKYINRICSIFEQAGITDERLPFFKNWSEHVYQVDRSATGAMDRPGGADPLRPGVDRNVPRTAPSDDFLLQNYQQFSELVEQQGLDLGRRAQTEGQGPGGPAGGGGSGGGAVAAGSPQMLRIPRPTTLDGAAPQALPALPTRYSGQNAALYARLSASRTTVEAELAATEGRAAQNSAARQLLDDLLAKPLHELTPDDFALSSTLQRRLFDAAGGAVERMKAMARTALGDADAEIISLRKREDFGGFVAGVLEKCQRKGYGRIVQMDDIIRGRLNITDGTKVAPVVNAMKSGAEVVNMIAPRVTDAGVVRYPRYHLIVRDPETGLTHEWQIGTRATSTLYETTGIRIPDSLQAAADRLGKHFRTDLHDIEYDVFQAFTKKNPAVASELGIPGFIDRMALASQRSAAGSADTALSADIAALHEQASTLLQQLVDRQGPEEIARLFH